MKLYDWIMYKVSFTTCSPLSKFVCGPKHEKCGTHFFPHFQSVLINNFHHHFCTIIALARGKGELWAQ